MIALRPAETDVDLDAWAELKSTVVPNEPVTAKQLRASDEPGRLLLLAELDGTLAGCGIAARSGFAGLAFLAARVLPEHRRRGVGSALVGALADHGRSLGREGVNAFVYANGSATAEHGLTVVRRDRPGRGIGRLLKQAQLHWAAQNGVVRLVTWTQKGNEAMQSLNRSLGYTDKSKVLTYRGPLP